MGIRFTTRTARVVALGLGLGLGSVALGGCLGVDGVTAGTVVLLDDVGDPAESFELGEEQVECATPSTSAVATPTTATTGTITVTATSDQSSSFAGGGGPWRVQLSASLSGSYTGNGTALTLTGSATAVLRRVASEGSCTVSNTSPCTIGVSNLTLVGTVSPATLPTFAGTTTTLDGGNNTGDTTIAGTTCGGIVAINQGSTEIVNLIFEA